MASISVKRRDVAHIVAATFPQYAGRKFKVEAAETVMLSNLNWDGGTRSQYRTCTLDAPLTAAVAVRLGSADKYNAQAPWANQAEGKTVPVPQGAVIVEHVMFCGNDAGLYIYVNPQDMPKLLPQANAA